MRYGYRNKFVKGSIFPPEEHEVGTYIDTSALRHTSIVGAMKISKGDVTDAGRVVFTRDDKNKITGVTVSGDSVGLGIPTKELAAHQRADTIRRLKVIFESAGIPVTVEHLKRDWQK